MLFKKCVTISRSRLPAIICTLVSLNRDPFTARVTSDAPVKIDTDATVNDYRCATLLGGEAPSRLTINDLLIAAPLLAGQHSALIAQSIVGRPFVANHQVELS